VGVEDERPKREGVEAGVGFRILSPGGYSIDVVDVATAVAILREVG
jgi:hypothetical protein